MGQSPLDDELRDLSDVASYLESEVTLLKRRIRAVEELIRQRQHIQATELPPVPAIAKVPKPASPPPVRAVEPPAPPKQPSGPFERSRDDDYTAGGSKSETPNARRPADAAVEVAIGKTWMNRIGALVLLVGVGFFVKYSFDQGWISPLLRVSIGAVVGLALVGTGQYCLGRRMQAFAIGLLGAGIAILYFSVFASHYFYDLTTTNQAFVLLSAVTALSTIIAVRGGIMAVAVLGLIGGFWTPLALSTGIDRQIALMSYLLVLDAGFLLSGSLRKWDVLRLLCWLGTGGLVLGWYAEFYHPAALERTLGFLAAFYVLFQLESVISLRAGRSTSPSIIPVVLQLNNIAFFASTYFLARETHLSAWLGLFCILLAASQIALGKWLKDSEPAIWRSREGLYLDAAGMLALAAPIQFDRFLVPTAWAIQAVATAWLCRQNVRQWLRVKVVGILAAAVVHLTAYDLCESSLTRTLLAVGNWQLNWITVLFVFVGLACYGTAACLVIRREVQRVDGVVAWWLVAGGCALMLGIWAYEYERFLATWWWLGLSACWILVSKRSGALSVVACCICLAITGKFLFWDTIQSVADRSWSQHSGIVLNRAVLTGVLVSIAAALAARDLRVFMNRVGPESRAKRFIAPEKTGPLILTLSMLVLTWTGTFEIARVFGFESWGRAFDRPSDLAQCFVTAFWAVNALTIWVIAGRWSAVLAGYATVLCGAATVKFLVWDTSRAMSEGTWQHLRGFCSNRVFVAGLVVIGCWFVGCAVMRSVTARRREDTATAKVIEQMVVWGAFLSIWLPTFEILRGFRFEELRTRFADPGLAMHLALSVLWSVSAITLLALGFARMVAGLRYLAIGVFGVTLVKVFAFDLSYLQTVYRIASFVVLGLLLLLASLLYQWLSAKILSAPGA